MALATLGITGLVTALASGMSVRRKVAEMMVIGLGTALATYMIGKSAGILLGVEIT
jgi:VIT1/CCC1 family predicted Fe2+/Mn2+ transporter